MDAGGTVGTVGTVLTAGLASGLTVLGQILIRYLRERQKAVDGNRKQKHENRKYEDSVLREVVEDQKRQIIALVDEMKVLRQSHLDCEKRFAAMQARLEHAEKEINELRQQLDKP